MAFTKALLAMPATHRYELTVPGIPPSPNSTRGMHWGSLRRTQSVFRDAVGWQARAIAPREPLQRARVTITLIRAGGRERDQDNATASIKACLDGLKLILIADDSPTHIDLVVRQIRGKKRSTHILVEEIA